MTLTTQAYRTIAFDCDGVVLHSNRVKSQAFYEVAKANYDADIAEQFVAYHQSLGGISRWVKFRYLIEELAGHKARADESDVARLCDAYADRVRDGLMTCAVADDLEALRASTPGVRWMIVSGGAQAELRHVFAKRGLADLFDGGIFGSPDTKRAILKREDEAGRLPKPGLMFGDSVGDYEAAQGAGLDFCFVSDWTEVENWKDFVASSGVPSCTGLPSHLGDLSFEQWSD